jgi:hypothetical protein
MVPGGAGGVSPALPSADFHGRAVLMSQWVDVICELGISAARCMYLPPNTNSDVYQLSQSWVPDLLGI